MNPLNVNRFLIQGDKVLTGFLLYEMNVPFHFRYSMKELKKPTKLPTLNTGGS